MRADNKIIINADDFGYNTVVNKAILQSFQSILITSASLMANMPGFEDAVRLINTHRFISGRIGLHLNLTEGKALTEGIRRCVRFCDAEGRFIYGRQRSLFFLSRQEQKAIYDEFKAQLEKVLAAGVGLTHLDSHHHVHTEWAIAPLVSRLGREYGIPRIRLTRNMGQLGSYPKRIYKTIFNRWHLGPHSGLINTDYFGDIEDMLFLIKAHAPSGKRIEIMVHPIYDEQGVLTDYNRKDLRQQLLSILDHRNTICVSSADQ